jgi:two-component system response regulator MprA
MEDDAAIRDIITEELTSDGYCVDADNGAEALDRVARHRPTAIVLDLMMPVMHGWDFVEKYRGTTAGETLPIIVVWAAGAVPRSTEALGVRAFLAKPFEIERLARLVGELAGLPGHGRG